MKTEAENDFDFRSVASDVVVLAHPTWRSGLDDLWQSGTWRGSPEDQDDASPKFKR